jgi:enoyl-CoA hydratase
MPTTLSTHTESGVRVITLTRGREYNTIIAALRDELAAAIDEADQDPAVHVILLRAEGAAFCAGYRLAGRDPANAARPGEAPAWDSVQDMAMIGRFVEAFMKLWYTRKPTISAVHGWCIGGGTDMVLCSDIIIAADDARFGYPPSRVWGTPTTAMWVYRMGLEKAKRYMLTGDEIPAKKAAELGLILETVPADQLWDYTLTFAKRMAQVPTNQLIMLKMLANETAENMGLASSRRLGTLFDGIARHTQEGLDFVKSMNTLGHRDAVRARDDPFGDYGSRPRQ